MHNQVGLIKQSLHIAIAERVADRKLLQRSSAILDESHDLRWVLFNLMANVIMNLVDKGDEVDPREFMDTLRDDVVEFFDSLV
jgi:hypothetical protein